VSIFRQDNLQEFSDSLCFLNQAVESVLHSLHYATATQISAKLIHLLRQIKLQKLGVDHLINLSNSLAPSALSNVAHEFLQLLNRLRHETSMRMALLASGKHDHVLVEEYETLCWETLSSGVFLMYMLQYHDDRPKEKFLDIGQLWEKVRTPILQFEPERTSSQVDQILYVSIAARQLDLDDLQALQEQSKQLNAIHHITGFLVHHDGIYLQFFEGSASEVTDLWARLLRDDRHCGVTQIYHRREIKQRAFQSWDMHAVDKQMMLTLVTQAMEEANDLP
jgi:hypothetical protein